MGKPGLDFLISVERLEEGLFQLPRGIIIRLYLLAPPEPLAGPDSTWTFPAALTAYPRGDEACQPLCHHHPLLALGAQWRDPDPSGPGPRPEGQQSCEGTGMWGAGGVILKGE